MTTAVGDIYNNNVKKSHTGFKVRKKTIINNGITTPKYAGIASVGISRSIMPWLMTS